MSDLKPIPMKTHGLPIGATQKIMLAFDAAANMDSPINTMVTHRLSKPMESCDLHPNRSDRNPFYIRRSVEKMRKWITARTDLPFVYIWVRENCPEVGEHWHLALHLPRQHERAFADYIAKIFGEPRLARQRPASERTNGEWACGERNNWHIARDTQPDRTVNWLGAYLGKDEPSQRMFRGRLVDNKYKPIREGRYNSDQGEIWGTQARKMRFDMARSLKQALKNRNDK